MGMTDGGDAVMVVMVSNLILMMVYILAMVLIFMKVNVCDDHMISNHVIITQLPSLVHELVRNTVHFLPLVRSSKSLSQLNIVKYVNYNSC